MPERLRSVSGIQADGWRFALVGTLDSRQKRAGMTLSCGLVIVHLSGGSERLNMAR